jgi:hypothetical protein
MRAPYYFLHGNLCWSAPGDAWAGYRLEGQSYPGLSLARKVELKERLEAFAYYVETDFQIVRVARQWDPASYVARAQATLDPRRGHPEAFRAMLERHRAKLAGRRVVRPETYLFVRLGPPIHGGVGIERLRERWRRLERSLGLGDARGIGSEDLEELRRAEERAFDRVLDHLPCERARSGEVAGLVRRAYARELGDPDLDPNWRPQALWVGGIEPEDSPEARFEPYEHDLLRLHESRLEIRPRSLRIHSELGTSHQALLVLGALPEDSSFPGPDVELLFAPLELPFPVDAALTCEFVPNPSAQKLAQKRMVDADVQAAEEGHGAHGPSPQTHQKTHDARELQARLAGSDRPPFLRSAITLAVAGRSEAELEERVDRVQAEFGRVRLHRPFGEQHRLFLGAMPAQPFPIADYKAHLLPEQLGAMVPTAISFAGSEIGPYIGHALTGSRAPVLFDLGEASNLNRPPTVLLTGSLGSGKTILLQTLLYQAFLQGSAPIVDIDPKGDHRLESLPGVGDSLEAIELGPEEPYRGLLDPMRVADDAGRETLASAFLLAILPRVPPQWETEIHRAVAAANRSGARTTGEVVAELRRHGSAEACDAASALEVHLEAGFARLGYGRPGDQPPEVGGAQVVSLRIRNLIGRQGGVGRSEMEHDERVGQAVLRLLAEYALRLCSADTRSHAVLALDEAWALLSDRQGKAVLERFSRVGRSMRITPLLASQMVGDAETLEPLVGSYFAFGVEREEEAERALRLLRLDPDDESARQRLIGFRAGRCFYLDHFGRTLPIQVDPGAELLAVLDTTPGRAGERAAVVEGNRDAPAA